MADLIIKIKKARFLAIIIFSISIEIAFIRFAYCKNVYDQTSRKLNIPENPQRVISLAPNITEFIFALGKEDILKGVSLFSDYPHKTALINKIGSYARLDIEKIVALKPDLCIGIKEGGRPQDIKRIEGFNIPVYIADPVNLESMILALLDISFIINAEKQGETLAASMRQRIENVCLQAANFPKNPRVFIQIDTEYMITAGRDTFINSLIEKAGGLNVALKYDGYPKLNREAVLLMNPEVIIISDAIEKKESSFKKAKNLWNRFSDINAVKNKNIFYIDANILSRPGPRLVDGLESLFAILKLCQK